MKKFLPIIIFLCIFLFLGVYAYEAFKSDLSGLVSTKPQKIEITQNIVLKEIESMGKLELVKYKFKDVVEYNVVYEWVPNSKAILIIAGEVVACLDLTKVKAQDVIEKKDTVFIQLPKPEICYTKINHQDSKVYDTQYTYFREAELVDEAYKLAEKQLTLVAEQSDILQQAQKNATQLLKPLFERISQKKVILKTGL